ncbi:MAG: rRNA maturation RNase YbeY [Clostridia bacterium]|jgi:probable rRNA maturation factor|nr:rRNA maturation RNase YbeY [Clostridia bacterium]
MPISISNRQDKVCLSPELENIINRVLNTGIEEEQVDPQLEVSVALVDDETIRELNRDYRNVDRPTDVLSFAYREDDPDEPDYDIDPSEEDVLGDIIISLERAKVQAEEYGHSLERELGFLVAHGFYHLLGYDHLEPEEEALMEDKVEGILALVGLVR